MKKKSVGELEIYNNDKIVKLVIHYAVGVYMTLYIGLTSPQSTLAMSKSMRTTTPDLPTPALQ